MRKKIIIGAAVVLVLAAVVLYFFMPKGPDVAAYEFLKDPRIAWMPEQKMLVVTAKGDPNAVGGKAFKLLLSRTSVLTVLAVLAAFGFHGPAQDAAPSRAVESQQVNPVGERPEHQRLSKVTFPALLREFGDWSTSMLKYFDAVQARLGAAADATFGDVAADPGVRRIVEENRISLFGGPMLGCVGPRHASVWMRTLRPARVEVVVTVAGSPKRFGPVESTRESDLTAIVPVTGLVPGAVHPYRVFIDGTPAAIPEQASIETWPDDGRLTGTRIVFGSCFHRWGLSNALQANTIARRNEVHGLNLVGLKRAKMPRLAITQIKQLYKLFYRSGLALSTALNQAMSDGAFTQPEAREFIGFVKSSPNGICSAPKGYIPRESFAGRED